MKRVFLCVLQSKHAYPIPSYSFWLPYFKNGFERAGWEVVEPVDIDFAEPLALSDDKNKVADWQESTWPNLISQVKKEHEQRHITLFFSYFYNGHARKEHIDEIKKLGIPTVNFFCDNLRDFYTIQDLVGVFDLHWVPEKKALQKYNQLNANAIYMPMCMDMPEADLDNISETSEISFIGSADWCRALLMSELKNSNIPITIYGNGWVKNSTPSKNNKVGDYSYIKSIKQHLYRLQRYGLVGEFRYLKIRNWKDNLETDLVNFIIKPSPDNKHYLEVLKNSMISLGINRYPNYSFPINSQPTYSRLRDVEAPMVGACYLTEYTDELGDMYEIGKDIEVYSSAGELIEKANILLSDKKLRQKMRERARKTARNKHTMQHRLHKIEKNLGI